MKRSGPTGARCCAHLAYLMTRDQRRSFLDSTMNPHRIALLDLRMLKDRSARNVEGVRVFLFNLDCVLSHLLGHPVELSGRSSRSVHVIVSEMVVRCRLPVLSPISTSCGVSQPENDCMPSSGKDFNTVEFLCGLSPITPWDPFVKPPELD